MAGVFYSFDVPFLFKEEEYILEYKSITFKLANGGEKYQNCLGTIVNNMDNYKLENSVALELITLIGWSKNRPVIYSNECAWSKFSNINQLGLNLKNVKKLSSSLINESLPKELPNCENKKNRNIIAIYNEALIALNDLPIYAFLCFWRLIEMIDATSNPSEKIYNLIGSSHFKENGFKTKDSALKYLKERVRNAGSHGYRGSKRVLDIANPEVYYEITRLNQKLLSKVRNYITPIISANEPFKLYKSGLSHFIYQTEKQYYGYQ